VSAVSTREADVGSNRLKRVCFLFLILSYLSPFCVVLFGILNI
jgi:hypothetical protein